jgi:hypothetical protein
MNSELADKRRKGFDEWTSYTAIKGSAQAIGQETVLVGGDSKLELVKDWMRRDE